MKFQKLIALLLAMLLIVSLFPTALAAPAAAEPEDIWEAINALEAVRFSESVRALTMDGAAPTVADYAALSEQVAALVEGSDSYVQGTLERHGSFLFWKDVSGEPMGYSPRLRERMHRASVNPDADVAGSVETVSFAPRGGSAGSMDVAVFQPYIGIDGSFTAQYENEGNHIAQATGGTATTYKTNSATVVNIGKALSECGVVIFDSHGDTDYANGDDYTSRANTSYICLQSGAGLTTADMQQVTGTYGNYYHAYYAGGYGSMKYYCVDGTAMRNHMTSQAPNSLLWMAICLGMATDGLNKPLYEQGVEVVYGYSQSVTFSGDYAYEKQFWNHIIDGYNAGESFAYMKQKCGCDWDPAYSGYSLSQAISERVAFPVMMCSETHYPGHGNVDKVQVPVSYWTLLPTFDVQAVSNNEAWGTVSASGVVITATPAEGYYTAGAEVLEGTATLSINGDKIIVTPETDCKIQVNFAAKTPATLTFATPEGVSCASIATFQGDTEILPTPDGTMPAPTHEYQFLGWAEAEVADTETRPDFLKAGDAVLVTGDKTFYALYSYRVVNESVVPGVFDLLDSVPANWAGEYVLTYKGEVLLDASGENTGSGIGGTNAAIPVSSAGITLDDGTMTQVADRYVYVVEAAGDGAWTLRMKNSDNYLSYTGKYNSLNTTTDKDSAEARWTLSFNDEELVIRNANTTNRVLRYNTGGKVFRCYKEGQMPLTLYAASAGSRWYTTAPTNETGPCAAGHTWGQWTVTTAPTCTQPGEETHTCQVCSIEETRPVDALGHDWKAPTYEWAEDNSTVTASRVCARDESHTETETVATTSTVTTAATVETEGVMTYTAEFENPAFEKQTKEVPIPKLEPTDPCADGHDWGEWEVTTPPSCTQPGEETRTCRRCSVTETRPVDAPGHHFENGVCTVCGEKDPDYVAPAFEDVPADAYYADAVAWAVEHNVTKGTSDTTFSPNKNCTRAQVVTFLWRANGEPEPEKAENPFTDVKQDAYYYKAVLWAVENNITTGTSETTFSPDKACTRAQVVTFLFRAEGEPKPEKPTNPFTDVKDNAYYFTAVLWAVENDITTGTSKTTFSPDKACTRAQVVTFLYRDLE